MKRLIKMLGPGLLLALVIFLTGCASNTAPVITGVTISPSTIGVGDVAQLVVLATDAEEGSSLTYAWASTANQGTFTDASARVTNWTAGTAGDFEFTIAVSDGKTSTTATAGITVGDTSIGSNPSTANSSTPSPVTQLRATDHVGSSGILTLSWFGYAPPTNNAYYDVYQSSSYFADISTLTPITQTTERFYNVTGLTDGVSYYYAVVAVNSDGLANSSVSPTTGTSVDDAAPSQVSGLTSTSRSNAVYLSWSASAASDLAGYNVYRSTSSGVSTTDTRLNGNTLIGATSYTDGTATNDFSYFYVVTAVDSAIPSTNESPLSLEVHGDPTGAIPNAPSSANVLTYVGYLYLSWESVNSNIDATAATIAQYNIYRSTSETSGFTLLATVQSGSTSYFDVSTGTRYYYKVAAVNASGQVGTLSGTFTTVDDAAPAKPATFVVQGNVPEDGNAHLSWTGGGETDLAGFRVYMAEEYYSTYNLVLTTPYSTGIEISLAASDDYFFKVAAFDYSGNQSDLTAYAVMNNIAPETPSSINALATGTENNTIVWSKVAEGDMAGYRLYRNTSSFADSSSPEAAGAELIADEDTIGANDISYSDTAAGGGITYFYRILAVDAYNNRSNLSPEASVTTLASE